MCIRDRNIAYSYSRTEATVHEVGHNIVNKGHVAGYEYYDEGLSSNVSGKIYPTIQNTKDIIKDNVNRQNLKTKR